MNAGSTVAPCAFPVIEGSRNFYDLRRDPVAYMAEPFHPLSFHIPQGAPIGLADELGSPHATLVCRHGEPVEDGVRCCYSPLPALHGEQQSNALFVDHVLLVMRIHRVQNHGGVRMRAPRASHGLAPWQERRATRVFVARIGMTPGLWRESSRRGGNVKQ